MSDRNPIAFRPHSDLRDRLEKAVEDGDEYTNTSNFLRELVEEALDRREQSAYERMGLPRDVGAQLEVKRAHHESEERVVRQFLMKGLEADEAIVVDIPEETDLRDRVENAQRAEETLEEVVRRLVVDGLDAREQGVLESIGADEELRHLVDTAREEGEDKGDAVRRLIRRGAKRQSPIAKAKNSAVVFSVVTIVLLGLVNLNPPSVITNGGAAALLLSLVWLIFRTIQAAYWRLFGEGREVSR